MENLKEALKSLADIGYKPYVLFCDPTLEHELDFFKIQEILKHQDCDLALIIRRNN